MTFKKIRETNYDELKMLVTVYEHLETGAQHIHTSYDTVENTFNVNFTTLPESSNGLPHILEHSVLNGSEKFPMNSVILEVQGRNFETFSNAMTGMTSTQYPFSTIDKTGYFNLMSVYLDAVFFPKLEKEVFLQEGWRYSFEDPKDSSTPLQYSGVVYNEMKGAYTSANGVFFSEMMKQVFSNTQYENYSGGHPLVIPQLTYEQFLDFHKKYYHPSNATFYTFGSIAAEEIQEKFELWVLSRFNRTSIDNKINTDKLDFSGKQYHATHPADSGYIYFKGYKIDDFKTVEDMYETQLLHALLQSGKSNIRDTFVQKGLGISMEGVGLLPIDRSVTYLLFKMEELQLDNIEAVLAEYFEKILTNGIDNVELNNVFNYLEYDVRRGQNSHENLGLRTIDKYMESTTFNVDKPEDIHNLNILKNLKVKFQDKNFVNSLIKKHFVDNKHSFEFISQADPEFGKKMEEKAQEALLIKSASLSEDEKQDIVTQSIQLEALRVKEKDLNLLPKISLNDVVVQYPTKEQYTTSKIGQSSFHSIEDDGRGISCLKLNFPLSVENDNDLYFQNLTLSLMSKLNLKNMTLENTALWKQTNLASLSCDLAIVSKDKDILDFYFTIESKTLTEYTKNLVDKSFLYSRDISFENKDLIVEIISQMWRKYTNNYQERADSMIKAQAESLFSHRKSFITQISTDYYTTFLKDIYEQIKNKDFSFIQKIEETYQKMFSVSPTIFFYGDVAAEKVVLSSLTNHEDKLTLISKDKYFYKPMTSPYKVAFDYNMQINHTAYTIPVAPSIDQDGGKLKVLSSYITPYLLTNIREKGGAYGAHASYDGSGLFTLSSYRDPNITNTLEVFKNLKDFILNATIDENELEKCKLNIIKSFNKPRQKMENAMTQFNRILKNKDVDETLFINSVLSTTAEDLKTMVNKYFNNPEHSIRLATNQQVIEQSFSDWDTISLSQDNSKNNQSSKKKM